MKKIIQNKKKAVILTIAAILLIGICIGCMLWMRTPGVHFLFGFIRADLKENGYLYNPKEDKFLGQTNVVIKGNGNGITGKFNGEVSVAGYEVEGKPFADISKGKDSIWSIYYIGISGSMKENSSDIEAWTPEFSTLRYFVDFDTKNSNDFSIAIMGIEEPLYVVHAATEEEAREVFQAVVMHGMENVVWN